MIKLTVLSYLLLVCDLVVTAEAKGAIIPDVTVEVLKNGSFRAYIPDIDGLKYCAIHAKINQPIQAGDPGEYGTEVHDKTGGFLIAAFQNAQIKVGDSIHFWIFCSINRLGYERSDLKFTISDLLDEYPLLSMRCVKAATVFDRKETCVGDVIFEDDFSAPTIVGSKWVVEHWIPTYTPPSFYFNSYIDRDETRFIRDGFLYLKPIALQTESEVRGVLDLRTGCTSNVESECYIRSKSWAFVPPIKSSKITSKVSFKYGKVAVRAKLPAGEWLVPVIHLEQKDKENGESSPVVWIAYSRGNARLNGIRGDLGANLLFAGPVLYHREPNRSQHLSSKSSPSPFYQEFHEYSIEWKPGKMTFNIDNVEYGSVDLTHNLADEVDVRGSWNSTEAPYNKEYVLSLGVAVGGLIDFPDGYKSGDNTKPWSNTEPKFIKDFFDQRAVWSKSWNGDNVALQIDYVKIVAV